MTDNDGKIDGASALAILPKSATLYIWTHPGGIFRDLLSGWDIRNTRG
jgi:hypothetical protein